MKFLESERIYLDSDLNKFEYINRILEWFNDKEVTRWMNHGAYPKTIREIFDYENNTKLYLQIFVKKSCSECHIGNISLTNYNDINRSIEMNILIGDKNYWGKGYATEAISLLSEHCFNKLNIHRIQAGAVVDNVGSVKAFERNGFVKEGQLKDVYYCDGKYRDVVVLGKIKNY